MCESVYLWQEIHEEKGERSQHGGVWVSTCDGGSVKRKVREANVQSCVCVCVCAYLWWGIHEVECEQVHHTQRLQQQYHIGQVGALDFWHRCCQQLVFVLTVGVQPVRLADHRKDQSGNQC